MVNVQNKLVTYFWITIMGSYKIIYTNCAKSRRMRWVGHVARMGEERGMYRVLVGKPEVKRPLGRPRLRWEDKLVENECVMAVVT
jgi:hypothetical protein